MPNARRRYTNNRSGRRSGGIHFPLEEIRQLLRNGYHIIRVRFGQGRMGVISGPVAPVHRLPERSPDSGFHDRFIHNKDSAKSLNDTTMGLGPIALPKEEQSLGAQLGGVVRHVNDAPEVLSLPLQCAGHFQVSLSQV